MVTFRSGVLRPIISLKELERLLRVLVPDSIAVVENSAPSARDKRDVIQNFNEMFTTMDRVAEEQAREMGTEELGKLLRDDEE